MNGSIISIILLVLGLVLLVPMVKAAFFGAPWVPTPSFAVDRIIDAAELKPGEKVIDPGCGDGRTLFAAAKREPGIIAEGYELFFIPYVYAKIRSWFYPNVSIYFKDSRMIDLSGYDVVFCYMLPETLKALGFHWKKHMKPSTRVISYAFQIRDWKPYKTLKRVPEKNCARALCYMLKDQYQ